MRIKTMGAAILLCLFCVVVCVGFMHDDAEGGGNENQITITDKGTYHIYEFNDSYEIIQRKHLVISTTPCFQTLESDSKYVVIFKDGKEKPLFYSIKNIGPITNFNEWSDLTSNNVRTVSLNKNYYGVLQIDAESKVAKLLAVIDKGDTSKVKVSSGEIVIKNATQIKDNIVINPIVNDQGSIYYISNVQSLLANKTFFCNFNTKYALQFNGPITLNDNAFIMNKNFDLIFKEPVQGVGKICTKASAMKMRSITFEKEICSYIKDSAFKDAKYLSKIELNLFQNCSVGKGIFEGCANLVEIQAGTESDNGCILEGLLDKHNVMLSKLTMKNILLNPTSLMSDGSTVEISGEVVAHYSDAFKEKHSDKVYYPIDNEIVVDGCKLTASPSLKFENDTEITIDGIVYRLDSRKIGSSTVYGAQVVSLGTIDSSRNTISIPVSIDHNGTEYTVMEIGRNEYKGTGIIDNDYVHVINSQLGGEVRYDDPIAFKLILNGDVIINNKAFYYVKYFERPSGDTGEEIFRTGLAEIEGSSHITKVGERAFYDADINCFDFSNVRSIGTEAFYKCKNLKTVDLTHVKSIGNRAFVSSGIVGKLVIPSGCEVGKEAFAATNISSVDVSGNLGSYVFLNCDKLTSFVIAGNSIPVGTFKGCTSLASIKLDRIENIGNEAFSGCVRLSSVDLSKVKELGSKAFSGTGLTSVTIPSTIDFTGKDGGQFQGCLSLTTADFYSTEIPKDCFSGCENLGVFNLNEVNSRVVVIGEKAFEGTQVTSFTWEKVKEIGSNAFKGTGIAGVLDLSDIVFTEKSSGHFSDCSAITKVTLNQTSIPDSCFSGCTGLTTITISGVESIGTSAFEGCSEIDSVNLDGIKSFGDYAFKGAGIGGTINLTDAKAIGREAFAQTNVSALDASNLETMGISAFQGCESLASIELGSVLETIPQYAFKGCNSLKDAVFSNKVKIGAESFQGCNNFKISETNLSFDSNVVLGWSLSAFKDSGSIKSEQIDNTEGHYDYLIVDTNGIPRSFLLDVTIEGDIPEKDKFKQELPEDLCGIYANVLENRITAVSISNNDIYGTRDGALYEKGNGILKLIKVPWYCEYLEIDDETTDIGKNAFKDTAITELSIPSKVKIIEDAAFKDNKNLRAIHFEEGLEKIGINAFMNCDIESVSIPSTVVNIGSSAFQGNSNLDKVEFSHESKKIEIGASAFIHGQYTEIFLPPIGGNNAIFSSTLENVYISKNLKIDEIGKIFNSDSTISFYVYTGVDVDKSDMDGLGGCKAGSFADYYTIIDGYIHTYSYRSQEIDGHHIYFISEVGDLEVSDFKNSGTSASFGISAQGGYSYHDLELDVDGNTLQHKVGIYTIDVTEDIFVYVKERIPSKSYEVTFDSKGGSTVASLRIGEGRTLLDSQYPIPTKDSMEFIGWFITDSVEFTRDTPVNDNLRLTAHWTSASPLVIFYADLGKVIASIDGKIISSGDRIPSGSTVSFRYEGADCSEFVEWRILANGKEKEDPSKNLVINDVRSDVSVSVKERYHSASSILSSTITTDSPGFKEDLSMLWKTSFSIDRSTNPWTGHSSVPLIVDDFVYVRGSDKIYKIEVDTGFVEKTVNSVSMKEYYHYLGYAHGYIIDYSNGKVYDTDLNYMKTFDFKVSSVFFDDGSTYLYGDNKLYKYDLSLSECEWESVLDCPIFGQHGTTSSVVVEGDYIYYINAVKDSDRTICSIRTDNGQSADSIILDEICGFYMDDGWLTCYDDTLYVTAYTVGLFNSQVDGGKEGYVISIPISKGSFGVPTYTPTASRANSQFVVYNDRGYVNAGSSLFVFDIDKSDRTKLIPAYSVFTGFSHGGIVLNTGDATEDNNHEVLVYVIPYNPGSGLVIAKDHAGQTSGDVVTKSVGTHQYNSQAVRSTSDGKLIWYTDTGNIYCIGTARLNDYYFFIEDSNGSMWYHATGSTAADALSSLGSDVVTLNSSKELATVGGKALEGWSIWGLKPSGDAMPTSSSGYAWMSLNSLYDSAYNEIHYFAISKTAPSNRTEYVYADGDELKEYEFSWNIGNRSLIGKPMTQGSSENVVTIRFYDDGTEIEGTCLIGKKGSSLSGSFPSIYRSGWSGTWVDADGNPATFPTQFPSENTKYRIVWTQNSYTIAGEKKQVGSATYFEVSVTRASGEKDVAEPRLLLIAEYSNGVFTNVFSDALSFDSSGKASKSMDVGVSTENLLKVHVYLVSGKPLGAFESYGEYVCEVSS